MIFQDLRLFPRNRGLKSEIVDDDHGFLEKRPLKGKFSKNYSESIHHITESRLVYKFREIWLADRKSAKSCLVYLTKKQNFRKVSRSRSCADRAQNLSGPAPNNILGVPQISSKSVHFRRSYSQAREHR